ncbi:hypothetical protein [Mesorhizobium silamurunense]|uniref:hypothetical protein n=1 Tax=Mesorhizobium silamurunense TaxID=499528 RepID=UPI001782ED88|nr:hypothetical protein [Mesorhizobium silamurunense]
MTECDLPLLAGQTSISSSRYKHLSLFNMNVSHDGLSAEFGVLLSDDKSIVANIPHWELDAIISQLQFAAGEMRRRQGMQLNGSRDALRDICDNALTPIKHDVLVHPQKGDIVFLHRFENHAPVAIKMSPTELKIARAKTNAALARMAN